MARVSKVMRTLRKREDAGLWIDWSRWTLFSFVGRMGVITVFLLLFLYSRMC